MRAPPLSYSSISTFTQCPHKFYRTRITKDLPDSPPHPSAVWGNAVHKAIEDYLRDGVEMGSRFADYTQYARGLKDFARASDDAFVEHKLAVDAQFRPAEFDSPDVRYRGILDYLTVRGTDAFLLDHKTGKMRPSDQLALNAILIFAHFPGIERVHAAFFWLAERTYTRYVYAREHCETMEETLFAPIVKTIEDCMRTEIWPKKQSGLCGYCPVNDCEFHR